MASNPKISVIIPSFDGYRNGNVEILNSQLESQTLKPFEVIVVVGVSPNGKARNEGVKKASGDYYVFIDDDVILGNQKVIENLILPLIERKDIGITGSAKLLPINSNWFQRMSAKQIPHSLFPVQKEIVDSDMVSHMCMAMPAELFKSIGWENPDIVSGTDPDLRYRVRKAGYRICVVPDTWAYHPMPETFSKLMKMFFEKGKNSGIVRRKHPEFVFEVDGGYKKNFHEKRSFIYRVIRSLYRLFFYFITGQIIGLPALLSYNLGNMYGTIKKNI